MEYAIWNGKRISAMEVAENYELEKRVRMHASGKELVCPDLECENPVLIYRHGEKREPHFAHLNNAGCDYGDFDRENTSVLKSVRRAVFQHLYDQGYAVELEVKLLDHHYTHMLYHTTTGKTVAIEFGTQSTTANRIDRLTQQYQNKNIVVCWVVVGNTNVRVRENQTFFLNRYALNESENKTLLIISADCSEVVQYRMDENRYIYDGRELYSENYPKEFVAFGELSDLCFESGALTLKGFAEQFDKWLTTKQKMFKKRVVQLDAKKAEDAERLKKRIEAQKKAQALREQSKSKPTPPPPHHTEQVRQPKSYEERKAEILPLLDRTDVIAKDSSGVRWVRCEQCGRIDENEQFPIFGGSKKLNVGICNHCMK